MERAPWLCPACKKYHAPHVDTCPADSLLDVVQRNVFNNMQASAQRNLPDFNGQFAQSAMLNFAKSES